MRPKTLLGWTCIHVVCPSHDGAERQNPLGYFTDGARSASFGRALQRDDSVGLRAMASLSRTNNMRRVRVVLWLRSAAPRHCVVTHKQGTTTARIIARDP